MLITLIRHLNKLQDTLIPLDKVRNLSQNVKEILINGNERKYYEAYVMGK